MKMVTKTALANLKDNKGRNILIGIAMALTTILIFTILTIGFGIITLQSEAVNIVYPTWHIMYRDVSVSGVEALKQHGSIEEIGERVDVAQVVAEDTSIAMIYLDETGYKLNKIELISGNFPKASNEIAVSQGTLKELGIKGEIGNTIRLPYQVYEANGLSIERNGKFKICGILPDSEINMEQKTYAILVSRGFLMEQMPIQEQSYRVMYRLADANLMTTDEIEEKAKEIANDFGIAEVNVVANKDYLWANYVDPTFLMGIGMIVLIVVLVGILTIYSIYYVSMVYKVQQYGKLKALGATKKQIRQIVFREGMFTSWIAIPVGFILGIFISRSCFKFFMQSTSDTNIVNQTMIQLLEDGKVVLIQPGIIAGTILISLIAVVISLLKPMKTAGKISSIEAMRYDNEMKSNKKIRSGYTDLTLPRLARANLIRNKKRTAITVITLGTTGILFMVVATVLTCAKPMEIAREEILSDYRIAITSERGNQMHPEREWKNIQQNNPLNKKFEQQVLKIEGIDKIQKIQEAFVQLEDYTYEGNPWKSSITGLDEEFIGVLEKKQIQGSVTYEELLKGQKIILSKAFSDWFPEVKVGDIMHINIENGNDVVRREFEVGAIADYSFALTQGSDFILPSVILENICDNEITYRYEIRADGKDRAEIKENLQNLVDSQEYLTLDSYVDQVKTWEDIMSMMSKMGYVFMIILAGIGIMNLMNTMINSVYTRRRELGIMQAIGLSDNQLIKMLQLEGLFYTMGTLILSLGIGNIAGFGIYMYARSNHLMNITNYHYPLIQTILLILTVFVIQMLLTVIISKSFKQQSLIERVRFSE